MINTYRWEIETETSKRDRVLKTDHSSPIFELEVSESDPDSNKEDTILLRNTYDMDL